MKLRSFLSKVSLYIKVSEIYLTVIGSLLRLLHLLLAFCTAHAHTAFTLLWYEGLQLIETSVIRFYHFDSPPSFLYLLFMFNTAYAASYPRVMSLLWWRTSAQNISRSFCQSTTLHIFPKHIAKLGKVFFENCSCQRETKRSCIVYKIKGIDYLETISVVFVIDKYFQQALKIIRSVFLVKLRSLTRLRFKLYVRCI